MTTARRPQAWRESGVVPFAITVWGVFVAHTVSYWLTHRAPEARADLLARTGHSHWDLALPSALTGLGIAVIASFYIGWRRSSDGSGRAGYRISTLAFWNVAAFSTMELVERVLSGSGVASFFGEPAIWAGIAASILIAIINAYLLRSADLAGVALSKASSPSLRPKTVRPSKRHDRPHQFSYAYACWTRGPPSPSQI